MSMKRPLKCVLSLKALTPSSTRGMASASKRARSSVSTPSASSSDMPLNEEASDTGSSLRELEEAAGQCLGGVDDEHTGDRPFFCCVGRGAEAEAEAGATEATGESCFVFSEDGAPNMGMTRGNM